MEFKSNHAGPVHTDPAPINKSRLGIPSSLISYPPTASGRYLSAVPRKKPGKLDDVRASGWLDAMQSSSPPRKKLGRDFNVEIALQDGIDATYRSWLMKYPSALTSFEKITNYAKGKQIALFLDYDGTLSPIVDDPDLAFMSTAMRDAVREVAKHFPTAIISGRGRDQVYTFVGLSELYYAGSHGMDIMGPITHMVSVDDHPNCIRSTDEQGKEVNVFQPASEFIPMIDEVFKTLVEKTKHIKGVKVENNKFCASVHYRNVDEESWLSVAQCVDGVLQGYPHLRLTCGRKVLEVRPVIDWNKGKAVEFLLDSLGLTNREDVLPIYVGDDRTDEDAFKVLKEGNRGYGILVSRAPKESNACYSLRDPSEVMKFLKWLSIWKKSTKGDSKSI